MSKRSNKLEMPNSGRLTNRESSQKSSRTMSSKMNNLSSLSSKEASITLKMIETYAKSMEKALKAFKPRAQPYKLKMIKDSLEKDSSNIRRCLKKFSSLFKENERRTSKVVRSLMGLLEETATENKKILVMEKANKLLRKLNQEQFDEPRQTKESLGLDPSPISQTMASSKLSPKSSRINLEGKNGEEERSETQDSPVKDVKKMQRKKIGRSDMTKKSGKKKMRSRRVIKSPPVEKNSFMSTRLVSYGKRSPKFQKKNSPNFSLKKTLRQNSSHRSEAGLRMTEKAIPSPRKISEHYEIKVTEAKKSSRKLHQKNSSSLANNNHLAKLDNSIEDFLNNREEIAKEELSTNKKKKNARMEVEYNKTPFKKSSQDFSSTKIKNIYNSNEQQMPNLSPDFSQPIIEGKRASNSPSPDLIRLNLAQDIEEEVFTQKFDDDDYKKQKNYLFDNKSDSMNSSFYLRNPLKIFKKSNRRRSPKINISKYQGYKLINKYKNAPAKSKRDKSGGDMSLSFGFKQGMLKDLSEMHQGSPFKSYNSNEGEFNGSSEEIKRNQEWNRFSEIRPRDGKSRCLSYQNSFLGSFEGEKSIGTRSRAHLQKPRSIKKKRDWTKKIKFKSLLSRDRGSLGLKFSPRCIIGSPMASSAKSLHPVSEIVKGLRTEKNLKKFKRVQILSKDELTEEQIEKLAIGRTKKAPLEIDNSNFDQDSLYNPNLGTNLLSLNV